MQHHHNKQAQLRHKQAQLRHSASGAFNVICVQDKRHKISIVTEQSSA